jgi:hypothetical protein
VDQAVVVMAISLELLQIQQAELLTQVQVAVVILALKFQVRVAQVYSL